MRAAIVDVFPELSGNLDACVAELADTLNKHAEDAEADAKGVSSDSGKKVSQLGQTTRKWLFSMDADAICVLLADWDYDRASHLYWRVDHRDLMKMFEVRAEYEETRIAIAYEGALYGFGGELKGGGGGSGSDTKVYDMTKGGDSATDGWSALNNALKR